MNIIHLVRPKNWGGGEQYAFNLCRASVEEGHNVMVVTRGAKAVDDKFSSIGAKLIRLPLGGVLDFKSPWTLAHLIKDTPGKEVIIHVHNFKDAEIAARAKMLIGKDKDVRLVCTRHLVKKGKRSWRWNKIYKSIDCLIFVSDLARKEFLEGNPDIDPGKIRVIHNSIVIPEKGVPKNANRKEKPDKHDDCFIILFTGRISPEKGLETLISSLRLLKRFPIRLHIAGTGPESYVGFLKNLAIKEGVENSIDWIGFTKDVYSEIRMADICVAPSVVRESFGLTVIEFMSQGKPVITSDNGAQKEIITDGYDGFLIPPGDSEKLAATIKLLLENPALRKEIGENARSTFSEKFNFNVFFNRIMNVYKEEV